MIFYDKLQSVRDYAVRQTAIYEQFLQSLNGIILGIRGSSIEITPRLLRNCNSSFIKSARICYDLLERNEFLPEFSEEKYESELREFWDFCISKCNFPTFQSALRFGEVQAFHTIEAHGAIGLLAQRRAQEIDWKITGKNGHQLKATRCFYQRSYDYAYNKMLDVIVTSFDYDDEVSIVGNNLELLKIVRLGDLKRGSQDRENYFHFGSRNWLE